MVAQEVAAMLAEYGAGAGRLVEAVAALPPESLDHRPAAGAWSNREVILHLADSEAHGYVRCRTMLAEPGGTIMNYDEQTWCQALDYAGCAPGPAVELFGQLRRATLALLVDLPSEAWSASAKHSVRGPVSLVEWLADDVAHLRIHLAQLERNTRSWREASR